jgi:hypothetical protein
MNVIENTSSQEERLDKDEYHPLDKRQVNKLLAFGAENDNDKDDGYRSEEDPIPVVIFDSELQFIRDLRAVDIVFLVDTTASMASVFKGIKRFMRKLVWDAYKCLSQYLVDEVDVLMVGLVAYRDHPPQDKTYISQVASNLTSDFKQFRNTVMKLSAKGGGDGPEAVLDGLNDAVSKISWRERSFKFIYHILDSPPHGKMFTNLEDGYPKGCPCNLDYRDIMTEMRNLEIEYNIVKLSKDIDGMIDLFSEYVKIDVMTPDIQVDNSKRVSQNE